jgi:hypothetical protein
MKLGNTISDQKEAARIRKYERGTDTKNNGEE